jgi:hypothetical protein
MAAAPILHPSVRERRFARVSATSLAEYLILRSDAQDTVLHNSRYSHPSVSGKYAAAFTPLIAYNIDPRRPQNIIDAAKKNLLRRTEATELSPKSREEARRCLEAITLFQSGENAFGLRGLLLEDASKFQEINIEGTMVSIQPHLIVRTLGDSKKLGAVMLRFAKAPDPGACRLDATRAARGEHRREMGRYLVALMQMLLEEQPPFEGEVDRDRIFVADVRLGERIGAASDHVARTRAIRSACNQISRLWSTVTPRPSITLRSAGPP